MHWWFQTTINREKKLGKQFIKTKRLGTDGDQCTLHFNSNWAYNVLKEVGGFPSSFTEKCYFNKVKDWRKSPKKYKVSREEIILMREKPSLYSLLLRDKFLAAEAFIVSFDLECRGCESGRLDLTMSEKYKDFLNFMLKIANNYEWATQSKLTPVSVEYSKKVGIKATPQYCFRIKISKLKEIYGLAGPLIDSHKDKCLRHHIQRSSRYKNIGYKAIMKNKTKQKLYEALSELKFGTTTELQFYVNVGKDVICVHLNNLEKEGKIQKERVGKRYIWSIESANQRKTGIFQGRKKVS